MNGWTFLASDGHLHAWSPPRVDVDDPEKTTRVHARVRITRSARYHKAELVRVITEHEARPHPHAHPDDIAYTIGVLVVPPADFACAVATQSREDDGQCGVESISFAKLTWTQTALGTDFVRYEIQRSLDSGTTWVGITRVISEDIEEYDNYEVPRGIEAEYRIRTIGFTDTASEWSTPCTVTVPTVACEWLFVSDVDPSLNVGVQVRPDREYTYPTSGKVVVKELWGRDFQATFRPLENRGTIVALSVTASAMTTDPTPGTRAFDPLRAMFENTVLPYVCVLDPYGNAFLSTVVMAPGQESQPGDMYHVDLTVIEITQTTYVNRTSSSLTWRNGNLWRGAQTWRGA